MPHRVLGPWAPDLPRVDHPGVLNARNVYPLVKGYRSFPQLIDVLTAPVPATPTGVIAGRDSTLTAFHFAGSVAEIYKAGSSSWSTVSKAGGYTSGSEEWEMVQFGDHIIATNRADAVQFYTQGVSALFADLGAQVPKARRVGLVTDFIFLGDINDTVNTSDGVVPHRVHWSPINNPTGTWELAGSNAAKAVQTDFQDLEGGAGRVLAIRQAGESGVIFQERMIWRAEYIGGDEFFAFSPIETEGGALGPQTVAEAGNFVFYIGTDGFRMTNGVSSKAIGTDTVDRYFFENADLANIDRMSWSVDPRRQIVAWAFPDLNATNGRPNKIILYRWPIQKWSLIDCECEKLTRALPVGLSIDDLAGDLDVDYPTTFDEITLADHPWYLGAYDENNVLRQFNGGPMDIQIETGDFEALPNRVTEVIGVRPVTDAARPRVEVAGRFRDSATVTYPPVVEADADGYCPVAVPGRYHRARFTTENEASHFNILGFDADVVTRGRR